MRTLILLVLTTSTAFAGNFDRPEIAEAQRQAWVEFLYQDGVRRYQQGRILATIGGGALLFGAGLSLGEVLEGGPAQDRIRPGAAIAMASAPLLLAGLPSMAVGTGRMRKAMRMRGRIVPGIPLIAAWSLLGATAALPISALWLSAGPLELALAGGVLGGTAFALCNAQYRLNTAPVKLAILPIKRGAGLGLSARW